MLEIGGFVPFSTVDWPGKLAATVFLQGCPWRCTYCHNPDLQDPRAACAWTWEQVAATLERRYGQLDAVVFSGGEPTRQAALFDATQHVKAMGFKVGLHTAGVFPARLGRLLALLDWVALDIKATAHRYGAITGVESSGERAWAALDLVMASGVDYELRITIDPTTHTRDDILDTVDQLQARGARDPILQQARPVGTHPEYAQALAGRGMYDVIKPGDLAHLPAR